MDRRERNEGRVIDPPHAAARVRFPSDSKPRFVVFVDTEEEFDWTKPQSRDETSTETIKFLPEFQRLMDSHGARPSYLIDYPVANNAASRAIMRELVDAGNCTVGTQLHPWVNPPFSEEVCLFNSFVGNLPVELECEKLRVLTETIEKCTGVRPDIYRAGRYGVGPNTAAILEEAGYRMDVSVRPHFDYSHEGGPVFTRHDSQPYWAGPKGELLEFPLGVSFTGMLRHYGRLIYGNGRTRSRLFGPLSRSGLLSRVALTPEEMPLEFVRPAIRAMLDDGIKYISISFHSPSLVPGHTPYVRNSAELNAFYRWWDKILDYLHACGVEGGCAYDVLDVAWAQRNQQAALQDSPNLR
jgi:hypothetical protein